MSSQTLARSFALLLLAVTSASARAEAPLWTTPTYGTAHHQDYLGNTRVGSDAQIKVAYRVRAEHTGHVESASFYLVGGEGYSAGNNGDILVQIRTDDPSHPGFPSSTVLGSALLTSPLGTNDGRHTVSFSSTPIAEPSDLTTLPFLELGGIYHLVFTNVDADPVTNYVSVDCSLKKAPALPEIQPGIAQADLAVTMSKNGLPWELRTNATQDIYTPIYELHFWNSAVQGRAYQLGAEVHDLVQVDSLIREVRERFTVTGGDRPAVGMYARVKKVGDPSSLSLQLRLASTNAVLASVNVSASAVPSNDYAWVGGPIDYILQQGVEYYLLVKENSGGGVGTYWTYPLADGSYYGYTSGFTDGLGEVRADNGSWATWHYTHMDLQFYFELAE